MSGWIGRNARLQRDRADKLQKNCEELHRRLNESFGDIYALEDENARLKAELKRIRGDMDVIHTMTRHHQEENR